MSFSTTTTRFLLPFLLLTCAPVVVVSALGINCRGSAKCTLNGDADAFAAQDLRWFINGVPDDRWYENGEHIACAYGGICAFLQGTGGTNGARLKQLAPYIVDHGCTVCGSVPYWFPEGNNNVDDGQLTFNYVSNPKCEHGPC